MKNLKLWPAALLLLAASCIGDIGPAPEPPAGQNAPRFNGVEYAPATTSGPGSALQLTNYPKQKSVSGASSWGSVLADIESHLPSSYGSTYRDNDRITWGHETTHGINSHLRNYFNKTGKKANGFYLLNDRAAIVEEPNMSKAKVAQYVPSVLRGSRYSLYVAGSSSWNDRPLYLFDEWVAYDNGAAVGVDMVQKNLWTAGWRDGVAGSVEFSAYAIATAMAVKQNLPSYWQNNKQFREFLAWELRRSMDLFRKGRVMSKFKWAKQDTYYDNFKNSAAAAPLRDFVKNAYGKAFLDEVIMGQPASPGKPTPPKPTPPKPTPPKPTPPAPTGDADGDGIPNKQDLCSNTPKGAPVWKSGPWIGCAGGQMKDTTDSDGDGIPNAKDICGKTPKGSPVWTTGVWTGCAAGQFPDNPSI